MYEYECKKCGTKCYSAAPPETVHKECVNDSCDSEVVLSKLGREMKYGKEKAEQVLDKQ